MAKNRSRDGTSFEEALRMSAIQAPALQSHDDEDDDGYGDEEEEVEESDPDLADLNNPDIETLAEAPVLGNRPKNSDLFGQEAETFGRATSPKLYAQAAQFPSAVQFRVWRWENGIPVALGAIDAEATEEEFVRAFKDAMPKPGEGRFQFRMRPIDIRGQELGKEFTINISEHHATLKQLRERKMREEEEERLDRYDRNMMGMPGMGGAWGNGGQRSGDIIVNPPAASHDAGASYAEEMGRMFEQAVESAERRTEVLQTTLEQERDRLRDEENRRAQERISMAERSADVVQKMTEKLMASDRSRADEAMKAQRDNGQLMMSTLTTVFQQQQEASRQQTERMREVDMSRMSQDREFFERQRSEMELRRQQERDDEERRRSREKDEWERRREEDRHRLEMEAKRIEEQRKYELEQLRIESERRDAEMQRRREVERQDLDRRERELERQKEHEKAEHERKRQQEKEEWALRLERERQETEKREREMERMREVEREQNRMWLERERQEMARRESDLERKRDLEREELRLRDLEAERRRDSERLEAERRRELEREEIRARLEREKLEAERVRQQMIEERERWRQEMEDKRRAETMEWERKQASEREERERRERGDRERFEREKMEMTQRLERERIEWERKESMRREELSREENRRKDELHLQQKQMEVSAQRDREHAERMLELARLEREAQREAQAQRDKAEREARELSEKDRQRQHELTMREMEIAKERDREHAERMLQLSKQQSSGGLSGITEMLGMETPELLARIFGAGGGDEEGEEPKSGWMEVIPKVLGAVAEVGKAAMTAQAQRAMPQVDPRVAAAGAGMSGQVAIQTPEGIKMIPASMLAQMQMGGMGGMAREREPMPVGPIMGQPVSYKRRKEVIDMPEAPTRSASAEAKADAKADATVEKVIENQVDEILAEATDVRSEAFKIAEEVNTLKRAKEAKMPLPKQKAARKAIRELGDKLSKAEESEWSGMVTEAIVTEFAIYTYIRAVSVYAALAETKMDPELAERIVKALRESGMIPDDVPFTEDDWQRLNGAGVNPVEGAE